MEVRPPRTDEEFDFYYLLRWKILRAPWNQPPGSEKDDKEDSSIHLAAFENGNVVGVGRGHLEDNNMGQIRYMAVRENFRGKGIGREILRRLEKELKKVGARRVFLNARENAVGFYEKEGYKILRESHTLFGEIKHYEMIKSL